jgi:flavin reductase (DIM6/NTAB) family NADH-FMN oxidoreductase RutF
MSQFQPAASLKAMSVPTPSDMRATLANFATGVAVISTIDPQGRPFGMTVNSFNAVSLDPPLVLWSIGLQAHSLPIWRAARGFAVNILSAGQEDLSRRFSSRVEDRFEGVDWQPGLDGLPLLDGSVASFECRFWARYPGGDHEIMVGEVIACQRSDMAPLVYCQGRMGTLHTVR